MISSDIKMSSFFCKFSLSPESWKNALRKKNEFIETLPSGTRILYEYVHSVPGNDESLKENVKILRIY